MMDESTFGSIRHSVPILYGEFYGSWKTEMLSIFDEYNLSKYVLKPYVPPIDPLHPTPDEELDMLHNLRTVNLIIRGLPRNVLVLCTTLNAHTLCGKTWRNAFKLFLEESQ